MQNPSGNINNNQAQVTDFSSLFSISTIVEKLGNIASSNFGLDNVINTLGAIDVETGKVAKTFGIGQIEAEGITDAIIASRDEVFKLGGTWNDLYTTQTETSQALQRNVTLSVEGQKSLFAASEVSQQSVSKIVTSLKDVGISAYDAGKAMGQVVNAAREQGVSAKVVSEMVLKNVSSMNLYNFRDGVEGLSKMAAQATAMRIDMKTIFIFKH